MEKKFVRLTLDSASIQASGRRKGFYKLVFGVDKAVKNGYAFAGQFLDVDCEVEIPLDGIVISKKPSGSVKNYQWLGSVYRVTSDGLKLLFQMDWEKNFLSFRDAVAEALFSKEEESVVDQSGVDEIVVPAIQIQRLHAGACHLLSRKIRMEVSSIAG